LKLLKNISELTQGDLVILVLRLSVFHGFLDSLPNLLGEASLGLGCLGLNGILDIQTHGLFEACALAADDLLDVGRGFL
jgi:hypothetical protein